MEGRPQGSDESWMRVIRSKELLSYDETKAVSHDETKAVGHDEMKAVGHDESCSIE